MPNITDAYVDVPRLYVDDPAMQIEIWCAGYSIEPENGEVRPRFGYRVGPITGTDLYGPAVGRCPEPADMAYTLAAFLGATYECGEITEHGCEYPPECHAWLEEHAERFGVMAALGEERQLSSRGVRTTGRPPTRTAGQW